jgi:formylglycine-generating enzyme
VCALTILTYAVNLRHIRVTVRTGVNSKDQSTMVWIPAGDCVLGRSVSKFELPSCPATDANRPQRIYIDGYWISRDEVTVRQYRAFCLVTHRAMPPKAPRWGWQDDLPMTLVTWDEAEAYANFARGTLPTAAQWEKAAVGPNGQRYPWGNKFNMAMTITSIGRRMWSERLSPEPVGSCPGDTSPYGARDMFGNVSEWCADWYVTPHPILAQRNPIGPMSGTMRIGMGLNYAIHNPENVGDVWKDYGGVSPDERVECIGFRYVVNRVDL